MQGPERSLRVASEEQRELGSEIPPHCPQVSQPASISLHLPPHFADEVTLPQVISYATWVCFDWQDGYAHGSHRCHVAGSARMPSPCHPIPPTAHGNGQKDGKEVCKTHTQIELISR